MQDLITLWISAACVSAALIFYGLSLKANLPTDRTAFRLHLAYFTFYFVGAPLLHVALDVFVEIPISNSVVSLTWLNVIHSGGLLAASVGAISASRTRQETAAHSYQVRWSSLKLTSVVAALAGALAYVWLWNSYGLSLLVDRSDTDARDSASILVFILVESVPLLCGWAYIAHLKMKSYRPSSIEFFVSLLLVSMTAVVFSGTRGSRVAVIFQIISFLLLYHKLVAKIKLRQVVVFIAMFIAFNNLYSLYKYDGLNAVFEYLSSGEKPDVVEKYSRPSQILLQDMGRSDVAAVILDRVLTSEYTPPYLPHTYFSGFQLLLPQPLRSEKWLPKTVLGASAQYSVPADRNVSSTRIYGPAAEAALNFGIWFIAVAFFILGFAHKRCLTAARNSQLSSQILFYPLFALLPVFMIFYDFDNIVFSIVKNWTIPLIVYAIARVWVPRYYRRVGS